MVYLLEQSAAIIRTVETFSFSPPVREDGEPVVVAGAAEALGALSMVPVTSTR